jgi:hypothetical protein
MMGMPMHGHPMAMPYRYPTEMKITPTQQFPTADAASEKGNGSNILPPLSMLTNHLPPSQGPIGYPYPPQMYAYPMYYMQGSAPFVPYFPNPVRNFM